MKRTFSVIVPVSIVALLVLARSPVGRLEAQSVHDNFADESQPRKLDVGKLQVAELVASAVGGGKLGEGYVTDVAAYRLGGGKFEMMVIARQKFPSKSFFDHTTLAYETDYTDPGTGISGSLYKTTFADASVRHILFSNKDFDPGSPSPRRYVIIYNQDGHPIYGPTLALYGKMLK